MTEDKGMREFLSNFHTSKLTVDFQRISKLETDYYSLCAKYSDGKKYPAHMISTMLETELALRSKGRISYRFTPFSSQMIAKKIWKDLTSTFKKEAPSKSKLDEIKEKSYGWFILDAEAISYAEFLSRENQGMPFSVVEINKIKYVVRGKHDDAQYETGRGCL